jgi:hypothetical protein
MEKTFTVQGWVQLRGYARRVPMPAFTCVAPDGVQAAKIYAHRYGIPEQAWWDAGPKPQVVIRTEEVS